MVERGDAFAKCKEKETGINMKENKCKNKWKRILEAGQGAEMGCVLGTGLGDHA